MENNVQKSRSKPHAMRNNLKCYILNFKTEKIKENICTGLCNVTLFQNVTAF